jgi:MoaA/NifB/PqqE/SkfB family radical SAM enzyme
VLIFSNDDPARMKLTTRARRLARFLKTAVHGLADRHHPILAHLVPVRRCNLTCGYCNEYDRDSAPVPFAVVQRRVDRLAELRTAVLTFTGGEPLLHPELPALVAHGRRRGMVVTLNTNGTLLSPDLIRALNRASLDHLQISIDNIEPDPMSSKSLRLLEPKLRWLAEHADFTVAINSVVGAGIRVPEDALVIAGRARELGFLTSLGIVHDGRGQLRPLGEREMQVYATLRRFGRRGVLRWNPRFQDDLAEGRPHAWRCRAGARYLYVDEDGLVHYCSQQRGTPGIPLETYGLADIQREYDTPKACAAFCTVNCVQQVALFDNWRAPQSAPAVTAPGSAKEVVAG